MIQIWQGKEMELFYRLMRKPKKKGQKGKKGRLWVAPIQNIGKLYTENSYKKTLQESSNNDIFVDKTHLHGCFGLK